MVPWVAHQLLREAAPDRRSSFDEQLRAFKGRTDLPEMYVACFTEASDLLSQWRGYASPSGYALGFSLDGLKEMAAKQHLEIGPVAYTHAQAEQLLRGPVSALLAKLQVGLNPTIEEDFRKIFDLFSHHFSAIYETCMLVKHPGFSEEREWRIYSKPWTDYRPLRTIIERRGELAPILQMDLYRGTSNDDRKKHDICVRTYTASPGLERERRANAMLELISELNLRWSSGWNVHDAGTVSLSSAFLRMVADSKLSLSGSSCVRPPPPPPDGGPPPPLCGRGFPTASAEHNFPPSPANTKHPAPPAPLPHPPIPASIVTLR